MDPQTRQRYAALIHWAAQTAAPLDRAITGNRDMRATVHERLCALGRTLAGRPPGDDELGSADRLAVGILCERIREIDAEGDLPATMLDLLRCAYDELAHGAGPISDETVATVQRLVAIAHREAGRIRREALGEGDDS